MKTYVWVFLIAVLISLVCLILSMFKAWRLSRRYSVGTAGVFIQEVSYNLIGTFGDGLSKFDNNNPRALLIGARESVFESSPIGYEVIAEVVSIINHETLIVKPCNRSFRMEIDKVDDTFYYGVVKIDHIEVKGFIIRNGIIFCEVGYVVNVQVDRCTFNREHGFLFKIV